MENGVLTKPQMSNHHFNAYYHNNTLLIQFILSEFILSHQITKEIEIKTEEAWQVQDMNEFSRLLTQYLQALLRSETEKDRWVKGPLIKIKDYCEQFSHNLNHSDKTSFNLCSYIHKTWLIGIKMFELLNSIHKLSYQTQSLNTFLMAALKRTFTQFTQRLKEMSKHILKLLSNHRHEETVLFFILRKKNQLIEIFGNDFFGKMIKINKTNSLNLIKENYIQRGFEHLVIHLN